MFHLFDEAIHLRNPSYQIPTHLQKIHFLVRQVPYRIAKILEEIFKILALLLLRCIGLVTPQPHNVNTCIET